MTHRLIDVDVSGVHFVGDPANQRPFAIVKGAGKLTGLLSSAMKRALDGGKRTREQIIDAIAEKAGATASAVNGALRGASSRPNDKTLSAFASVLDVKLADLKGALPNAEPAKSTGGDQTVKLADILKAAGLKAGDDDATKEMLDGDVSVEKMIEAIGKDELAKALGVEIPDKKKKETELDKSKLPPEVASYVEAMEKKLDTATTAIDEIVTANEAEKKADLEKRVKVLKAAGIDIPEGDPTLEVVTALEKAGEAFQERLRKMGVLVMKGDPEEDDKSAEAAVRKAVHERLGHAPLDAAEDSLTRREIYRQNPGLLKAVLAEERRAG